MRRKVQVALLVFGLVCLSLYGIVSSRAMRYQRHANAELEARRVPETPADAGEAVRVALQTGDLVGRVEIPRLALSAAIAEGDDDKTLGKAVGHLPDTPFPWDRSGNVALAAHRDGLFRPLEHIRENDEIVVTTPQGDFHYRVARTHIVDPDDVWVLAPTEVPTLTLITCYPFSFIGNAPRRFIVQAEMSGTLSGTVVKGRVVDR